MPTLSYKYRIEPNRMQAGALSGMLEDFCQLYNAALQQRIEAYRRRSISLQYGNQALELKAVRCAAPALARWSFSSHKISRNIVNRFGRIAVEDLNIKGLARAMLAKHVADASWAQLAAMLDYKAASAGVEFVRVDPRGTSQQCPQCGQVAAKALDERRHRCDCVWTSIATLLRLWSYTFVPS